MQLRLQLKSKQIKVIDIFEEVGKELKDKIEEKIKEVISLEKQNKLK